MIEEAEVITLLLGLVALLVTFFRRRDLRQLPASKLLLAGFFLLLAGWVVTILEGFAWKSGFDFQEHFFYASSSLLVAAWCWRLGSGRGAARP